MRIVRVEYKGRTLHAIMDHDENICELKGDLFKEFEKGEPLGSIKDVKILAPVQPSKVVALGLNYRDHAEEMKLTPPQEPLLFLKPGTSITGQAADIVYPEMSSRVDYEAELAIVIKKTAARVKPENADEYILGYTCLNDVTARDLQVKDGQWTRAKGFDTFCPIGPCIVTDLDTSDLEIKAILNDKVVQKSSTKELIFKPPQIIAHISNIMTLLPGDVIATGTPSGIGPMNKGDHITVSIQEIGELKNRVV